jgi:hypothetical protein
MASLIREHFFPCPGACQYTLSLLRDRMCAGCTEVWRCQCHHLAVAYGSRARRLSRSPRHRRSPAPWVLQFSGGSILGNRRQVANQMTVTVGAPAGSARIASLTLWILDRNQTILSIFPTLQCLAALRYTIGCTGSHISRKFDSDRFSTDRSCAFPVFVSA